MNKLPINIVLPEGFLKEEIKCGFLVTEDIKKLWAVELDLLFQLQRVCKKYQINYYADSGTLLGAIRHKGFIPWDDDIDIIMFRKDYNKLLAVAKKEFKYPYFFQTTYSDKMYIRGHAQLRNSETTGFIPDDKNKPFNKGIFLDIFAVDVIPDNVAERQRFINKVREFWKFLKYKEYSYNNADRLRDRICRMFIKKVFYGIIDYRYVFKKYEILCSKYNQTNNHTISYIEYSLGKEKHMFKKEWYIDKLIVPFEFLKIVIPAGFDKRLRKEYNDYMIMKHDPTAHGEYIYDSETPYKTFLNEI